MSSPSYYRSIDAVLAEDCEDVSFFEGGGAEEGAEFDCVLFEGCVGVVGGCEGVEVYYCGVGNELVI